MEAVYYFLNHYGYLGIFLLLALGIFGPPVADELFLLFLGYLVLQGKILMGPTVLAVIAGSLSGVTLDYFLGRTFGHYLLHRPDSCLHHKYRRIYQLRPLMARSGGWMFICSYFVPAWRHGAPILAGLGRIDFLRFAALTYSGGLLWSMCYLALGYLLGERWSHEILKPHHLLIIIGILASVGLAYIFWRRRMTWT